MTLWHINYELVGPEVSLVNSSIAILWAKEPHICEALCRNQALNAEILSILSVVFDYGFSQ